MDDEKKWLFPSYNAMSRPAMFMGIPILPFVGLVVATVAVGGLGYWLVKWWMLLLVSPFVMALIGFAVASSFDDRYMRRVLFALRRYRRNLTYGRGLRLTPINRQWSVLYGKRYASGR
ncbi:conjugal transfer protein [Pseudomonas protegens]|uniref:Conjugal transfer protein n=1 Tax=Pseudomonas protegens TaxID=380021 RepID=A0A2T6GBI4_9PSED|nr:VirB3 family type IV secretion system protein [Pseudomonas protegens]PUA41510.1 conjugal transfer protein [Pseudomonas protegens]